MFTFGMMENHIKCPEYSDSKYKSYFTKSLSNHFLSIGNACEINKVNLYVISKASIN